MATIFIPNPPSLQPSRSKMILRGKHRRGALMLLGLIVFTALLSVWQLWRAYDKHHTLQAIAQTQALPALQWSHGALPPWRKLHLQGQWLNRYEIWLDHRVHAGRVGYQIVTPFQLSDGTIVMVNRGWWSVAEQGVPPLAQGSPLVISQAWPRYVELGAQSIDGRVFQNLDPGRFAAWAYLPLPSSYALLVQASDSKMPLIATERPFGVERHLAYALSWLLMSVCGAYLFRRHYLKG